MSARPTLRELERECGDAQQVDRQLFHRAVVVIGRGPQAGGIVRIIALVVDPGVRERGVGKLLMAEAERTGAAADAAFVEVTAGHHRPEARQMYESIGYDATVTAYLRKRI